MRKRPLEEIRNEMANISQVNMEEMIREYGKEEVVRLMNMTMLKLQKQILKLQVAAEKKIKRQKDRE